MGFRGNTGVVLVLFALTVLPVRAQPLRGIVWDPPTRIERAIEDLKAMKAVGVEAVRTPLLRNESLYRMADSLGLQLYQDFPFDHVPASTALDSLPYAFQILQEAIWWAENHPSARHFGLARHIDTSVPKTCRFFDELVDRARQSSPTSFQFYYVTSFIESEQCAHSVDRVLLDLLDVETPLRALERWRRAHGDQAIGIGALGVWVRELRTSEQDGYELLHSPAYQARYLETNLNALLHMDDGLAAVFVYNWRDRRLDYPSSAHDLAYPYRHTYGLKTTREEARPAWAVFEGIYTGGQTVFAFPVGRPARQPLPWVIVLGWVNIALLGIGFANFPRFRPTVRRYFGAHSFYRDAVREGRELLFGPNVLLLIIVMMAFGISCAALLDAVRSSDAFSVLMRWLPGSWGFTLVSLLEEPLILIVVLASAFGLAIAVWTSVLSVASTRGRHTLLPGQTLILVVWPQWPILIIMTAAIVLGSVTMPKAPMLAMMLFIFMVLSLIASNIRVLVDYSVIARPRLVQRLAAWLGNPFLLVAIFGIYIVFKYGPKFSFFWHLITRT